MSETANQKPIIPMKHVNPSKSHIPRSEELK